MNGDISMSNNVFLNLFHQSVSESDWLITHILRQVLNIRDGTCVLFFLFFSDGSTLLRSELDTPCLQKTSKIIFVIATSDFHQI